MPFESTGPCLGFSRRFIAAANRITEIVHPVMIPTSSHCQLVVKLPEVKRLPEEQLYPLGDIVGHECVVNQHVCYCAISISQVESG